MIAIVDYGMGNLRSVQKAFEFIGTKAGIVSDGTSIRKADKLVVPGVGAFADARSGLDILNLIEPICEHIESGKLFLGICLGLQLLFTVSFEDGKHPGFDIIKGEVVRFKDSYNGSNIKITHIGWNQIHIEKENPLLEGIENDSYVYFVHSYFVVPEDKGIIAATTEYGERFTSMIWKDNIFATQFHPEKSQSIGLAILKNFDKL